LTNFKKVAFKGQACPEVTYCNPRLTAKCGRLNTKKSFQSKQTELVLPNVVT